MGKAANKVRELESLLINPRYERKFIFQDIALEDLVDTVVLTNSFCFNEIYSKRKVNNIYYDDNNLTFYNQNVSGDGERKKYRLRWYSNDFSNVKAPTIEIKKKFGEVGDKVSFKLKDLNINMVSFNIDEINIQFLAALNKTKNEELISRFNNLYPALYNSYERRYFLSSCEKFRITLDFNMNFFDPNVENDFSTTENKLGEIVLELKYGLEDDAESRNLSQQISSRLSKNSKYVRGVDIISS